MDCFGGKPPVYEWMDHPLWCFLCIFVFPSATLWGGVYLWVEYVS